MSESTSHVLVTDLRRMVQSFRVHELQALLAFANKNRFGRKQELQDRALELVTRINNLPLQLKVKEIYKMRSNQTSEIYSQSAYTRQQNGGTAPHPTAIPYMMQQSTTRGLGIGTTIPGLGHRPVNGAPAPANLVDRPNVKPMVLPFYDVVNELLPPNTLWGRATTRLGERDCAFQFSIPVEHIRPLSYDIQTTPLPRMEVQMRFLPYDTTCEQKDDFPSNCIVRINDRAVTLPPTIPTNKPGVEPKRPSRPVMITEQCQRVQSHHRLNVSFTSKPDKNWTVAIYLVKRLTASILLNRLINRGSRSPEFTKKQIVEKLTMESDIDIQAESHQVSVLCPLGKVRMSLPCRVRDCKHLQCFDADLFMRMNEKKPTWVCPVCDQPAAFDKLVIDGYFHEVVSSLAAENSSSRDIQVFADGSWKAVLEEDEDSKPKKNSPAPGPAPVIVSFDDSINEGPSTSTNSTASVPATFTPVASPPDEICIDLVSDDDEEESPRPQSHVTQPGLVRQTISSSSATTAASPPLIVLDSPPSQISRRTASSPGQYAPPMKKRLVASASDAQSTSAGYASVAQNYASMLNYGAMAMQAPNNMSMFHFPSNGVNQPTTSSIFGSSTANGSNSYHNNQRGITSEPYNQVNLGDIAELESRVSLDLQNFLAACNGSSQTQIPDYTR